MRSHSDNKMATGFSLEFLEGKSLLVQVASVKVLETVHKDDLQQRNEGEVNCFRQIQFVGFYYCFCFTHTVTQLCLIPTNTNFPLTLLTPFFTTTTPLSTPP